PPFLKTLPLAAEITTGLALLGAMTAGPSPSAPFGRAAARPEAAPARISSRRFNFGLIGGPPRGGQRIVGSLPRKERPAREVSGSGAGASLPSPAHGIFDGHLERSYTWSHGPARMEGVPRRERRSGRRLRHRPAPARDRACRGQPPTLWR